MKYATISSYNIPGVKRVLGSKPVNIIKELQQIMGKEAVLTSHEDLLSFSYDASPLEKHFPEAVVLPTSTEQVQALVRLAGREGLKLIPRGSGTGLSGGSVPAEGGIVLSFTRMNHILGIDSLNLTALVEPGVITATLAAEVEKQGLYYPPDPGSNSISTIGGNVAENAGGLRGLKYGVTKDYVLGLEAVLANGEIINYGCQSRKNRAGYDLTSLLVGSEGTLAIITRILLRLVPYPASKKTVLASFSSFGDAADCISNILGKHHIIPATLEFMDSVTMKCINSFLGNVLPANAAAALLIEVDGPLAATETDSSQVLDICRESHAISAELAKDSQEATRLASSRRAALPALSRFKPTTILEDVSVPPSKLGAMLDEINRVREEFKVDIGVFGHAGDGNLHPTLLTDERNQEEMSRVHQAVEKIFTKAISLGGTISGEHGIGTSKLPYLPLQYQKPTLDMMKRVKQCLDPNNLFNPGKIFAWNDGISK
jgi:glycolate oxidase